MAARVRLASICACAALLAGCGSTRSDTARPRSETVDLDTVFNTETTARTRLDTAALNAAVRRLREQGAGLAVARPEVRLGAGEKRLSRAEYEQAIESMNGEMAACPGHRLLRRTGTDSLRCSPAWQRVRGR